MHDEISFLKKFNTKMRNISELENICSSLKKFNPIYAGGIIENYSNLFSFQKILYKFKNDNENLKILKNNKFIEFIFNKKNKIIGVSTSEGIIFADKFIISGDNSSKKICESIGINLLIFPFQISSLEFQKENFNLGKFVLLDEKRKFLIFFFLVSF